MRRSRLYCLTWVAIFAAMLDYRFFANVPGAPSITILQLTSLVSLLVLVVLAATKPAALKGTWVIAREGRWVLMYFFWVGVAALWGVLQSNYESAAHAEDLLPGLVLFVLVILSVHSRGDLQGLLTAYKMGMVIEVVLGACQAVFGAPRPVPLAEVAQWKTDLSGAVLAVPEKLPAGLLMHPNGYALFLIPFALLLTAGLFYQQRRNVGRRLANACLLLCLYLVLWRDYTKGAYAWMALGSALVLLPPAFSRARTAFGWFILFGGVVSLSVLSLSAGIGTVLSRFGLWRAALVVLGDPLVFALGNGSNAMLEESMVYSNMYYPSSHNTFLDQAIVFGAPALLFYGAVAVRSIRTAARLPTLLPPNERGVAIFLHAGFVVLLGGFFFEPALFGTMVQAEFFLLAGFTVVLCRLLVREQMWHERRGNLPYRFPFGVRDIY